MTSGGFEPQHGSVGSMYVKGGLTGETHMVECNGYILSGAAAMLAALAALLGTRCLPMSCSSAMVRPTGDPNDICACWPWHVAFAPL